MFGHLSRKLTPAILAALCLSGCIPMIQAQQRQQQEAQVQVRQQQAKAEAEQCIQNRKTGIFKTYAQSAACVNDAIERAMADTKYPWPDLIMSLDALRSQLAAQVDAKKITEEDMKVKLADKMSEITKEELNRKSQLVSMSAQQQSAQAQTLSALAQSQAAQRQSVPQYQVPRTTLPHSTNCTTNAIGQTLQTYCNDY